jgi:hypothetical protein
MADVSVTPANVTKGANSTFGDGIAGVTIAAGDVIYEDTADNNKLKLADANAVAPANTIKGMAAHGASNGQPLRYFLPGSEINFGGAVLTQALVYVLSANPGKFCPTADLASGHTTNICGIAKSTSILVWQPFTAGVALA